MNTGMLFVGAATLFGLLGCSNTRVEPAQPILQVTPIDSLRTPPVYEYPPSHVGRLARQFEVLEQPDASMRGLGQDLIGRICQVDGESCLEIDDRPFETCLLSSQDCGEKIQESRRRGENIGTPQPGPPR